MKQFKRNNFSKYFRSIQYGCRTMWPINYSWTPWYPQGLGNMWVKFPLDISSHFGEEDFWRFSCKKTMWLPNHVTDDVINFFPPHNLARDDARKCSCLSDKAFDLQNFNVIKKPPMTSFTKTSHSFPMGSTSQVLFHSFFSMEQFQRYRGPTFFRFSNMAVTPRDLWHHNYH